MRYPDACSHASIIHTPRLSQTKKKRERGVLASPHHNDGTFTVGQPSLNSTLSPKLRGDELPQLTSRNLEASDYFRRHPKTYIRCQSHVILGLLNGLRPPRSYPSTRTIILKGHPMSLSEANSFQFTWGEPTRGVCGLHSINTSVYNTSLVARLAVAPNPILRSRSLFSQYV